MSRTFRRKNETTNGWTDLEYYTSERISPWGDYWYTTTIRVPYPKDSKEYRKGKAIFHSDSATSSCKEPGPSWFRNLFSTRPLRGKSRRELHKFIRSVPVAYTGDGREVFFLQVMDECYEPMIDSMGKLPYWT